MRTLLIIGMLGLLLATTAAAQDSLNVSRVGQLGGPGYSLMSVAAEGSFAYATFSTEAYAHGLSVVDVSDPAQPREVGCCALPATGAVVVRDGYAYIAAHEAGMRVLDVHDPAMPVEVGFYRDSVGTALGIELHDSLAFLAYGTRGLKILDIRHPATPVCVGALDLPGTALNVAVGDSLALVAAWGAGVQIIDILNLATPVVRGVYGGGGLDVAIYGAYAVVATGNVMKVVSIDGPAVPAEVAAVQNFAVSVEMRGEMLYALSVDAFWVFDLSDPVAPAVRGYEGDLDCSLSFAVSDSRAYITAQDWGLRIYDIRQDYSVLQLGVWDIPDAAVAVAMEGDTAFVVDAVYGLRVIDFSDPAAPEEIGRASVSYGTTVALQAGYAYVGGRYGLHVIDIGNPAFPVVIDSLEIPPSGIARIVLAVDIACATLNQGGFITLNLADPAHPVVMGSCVTAQPSHGLVVRGQYVYLAEGDSGLRVIDIVDPSAPVEVAACTTLIDARDVALSGDYLYVGSQGLEVVDIQDPLLPLEVGNMFMAGRAVALTVSGHYVYLVSPGHGLRVVDISEPEIPMVMGYYASMEYTEDLAVSGNLVCAAENSYIRFYDVSAFTGGEEEHRTALPAAFALGASYPNPFNATTVIPFALPQAAQVSLKVYDLLGREVATLVDGLRAAGEHRVAFAAKDLSTGVYFTRLEAGGTSQARKLVLLK